jgi:L-malate glycosyltransferase
MRTNILQLIGSFNQGGSERQAVQLTKLLRQDDKFGVFLATLNNEGTLRKEIEEINLEVAEFKLSGFYNANMLAQMRRFKSFVKENNIKLIHTHDFYTNIFGMFAGIYAGIPVRIASKRETAGMKTANQILVEHQAFRGSHKITVNADAVKSYLIKQGVKANKIETIYNGLDLERLKPKSNQSRAEICAELGLPEIENTKFVTIVANLHHAVKNHRMFLQAAKLVADEVKNVCFVMAGEGNLIPEMQDFARESGILENCRFTGRCEKVAELLSISSVCVLSSTNEGFSNSILEYMSASKPVVATNVGGASEAITEGETGYLVESNDFMQMAKRLIDLLKNDDKAEKMGKLGRIKVEKDFSTTAQIQKINELYFSQLKL